MSIKKINWPFSKGPSYSEMKDCAKEIRVCVCKSNPKIVSITGRL